MPRSKTRTAEEKAAQVKAWHAANPERRAAHRKKWNDANKSYYAARNAAIKEGERTAARRKAKFGTDGKDLLAAQNGACAICKTDLTDDPLNQHLDHDHATGAVRGMLCRHCNWGLGHFRDNPVLLSAAIDYLKKESEHE